MIEIALGQVVLRPGLHSLHGNLFIIESGEHDNRDVEGVSTHIINGGKADTIGQ